MKTFILALQFMTRIPIDISLDIKREDFRKIVRFFPIIGLIIGLFEVSVYLACFKIFSENIAAFFTVLSHLFITGGMHIDGLSDTVDGIFSGKSKDRILEIMKDSRVGTFGSLAIIFLILGKIIFISDIPHYLRITAIVLAPIISRTMNIFLMYNRKYARQQEGMGDMFIGAIDKTDFNITLFLGIIISIIIGRLKGIIFFILCFLFTLWFRSYIENKIQGLTGDILGASDELNEILIYIISCLL